MVIGTLCMVYFQVRAQKFHALYAVGTGLCLMALMMTFTRSIYGAAFISLAAAFILSIICYAHQRKRLVGQIVIAIAIVALLAAFQYIFLGCNSAQFALARTFNIEIAEESGPGEQDEAIKQETPGVGAQDEEISQGTPGVGEQDDTILQETTYQQHYIEDTQNSDMIRKITLKELREMIRKSPVFGNGLGAAIASREGGYVEYFYQDIVNKTGFLGLLLYYFPIGYMIFSLARKWKNSDADQRLLNITWICGIAVFIIATYFNPYMNSSLGICCYCIVIASFNIRPVQANLGGWLESK
jgi:O-antigen ligase